MCTLNEVNLTSAFFFGVVIGAIGMTLVIAVIQSFCDWLERGDAE